MTHAGEGLLSDFYNSHSNNIEAITRVNAGGVILYTYPYSPSAVRSDISY